MGCAAACLHHGKTVARGIQNNLIVRLHKDGKGYRKIGDQQKNQNTGGTGRYRTSHTTDQSCSGRPPKMTPRTVHYLHNLALKNRQTSASALAQKLSMEMDVSVITQMVKLSMEMDVSVITQEDVSLITQEDVSVITQMVRRILSASVEAIQEKSTLLALQHKTARFSFAKEHENKTNECWEHIFWSDETKITLLSSDGGQACLARTWAGVNTVKHRGESVLIWGCVSAKDDLYGWIHEYLWIFQNTGLRDYSQSPSLAEEDYSCLITIQSTLPKSHKLKKKKKKTMI